MISLHSQHGLLVRCQWVKMPWRMVDQQTESTSSRQTGKNRGLTTPMSSGSRTERSCWNSEINTAYRHQIITKNTSLSVFLSWVKLVSCPTRLSTSREQRNKAWQCGLKTIPTVADMENANWAHFLLDLVFYICGFYDKHHVSHDLNTRAYRLSRITCTKYP